MRVPYRISIRERHDVPNLSLSLSLSLSDTIIEYIVTGGAPTSEAVMDFLRKCFAPCPVYDGYGTTEVGGIATQNKISPGVKTKLIDVPELGYSTQDKPYPRGEICVITSEMVSGYFKNEKATYA